MNNKLIINDNNTIIRFSKELVFSSEFIQLEVDFLDELGNVIKTIAFSKCDDFQLSAFTSEPSFDKDIIFEFDNNSILYNCFINLLGLEEVLIIDDAEEMQKNITIEKKDNLIRFKFLNKKINNKLFKDFNILIKNFLTDYKNKLDELGKNSIDKLITLFESFNEVCFVEYGKENCNSNKVFCKKIPNRNII